MADEIKVTGLDELIKLMDELPDKIEKQVLKEALNRYSSELVELLSAEAPYNPNIRPGYYQKAAGAKYTKKGKLRRKERFSAFIQLPFLKFSIIDSSRNFKNGDVRNRIVANFYAKFLEEGTEHMAAEPFVEPTMTANAEKLLDDFVAYLDDRLKQLVEGALR